MGIWGRGSMQHLLWCHKIHYPFIKIIFLLSIAHLSRHAMLHGYGVVISHCWRNIFLKVGHGYKRVGHNADQWVSRCREVVWLVKHADEFEMEGYSVPKYQK